MYTIWYPATCRSPVCITRPIFLSPMSPFRVVSYSTANRFVFVFFLLNRRHGHTEEPELFVFVPRQSQTLPGSLFSSADRGEGEGGRKRGRKRDGREEGGRKGGRREAKEGRKGERGGGRGGREGGGGGGGRETGRGSGQARRHEKKEPLTQTKHRQRRPKCLKFTPQTH